MNWLLRVLYYEDYENNLYEAPSILTLVIISACLYLFLHRKRYYNSALISMLVVDAYCIWITIAPLVILKERKAPPANPRVIALVDSISEIVLINLVIILISDLFSHHFLFTYLCKEDPKWLVVSIEIFIYLLSIIGLIASIPTIIQCLIDIGEFILGVVLVCVSIIVVIAIFSSGGGSGHQHWFYDVNTGHIFSKWF